MAKRILATLGITTIALVFLLNIFIDVISRIIGTEAGVTPIPFNQHLPYIILSAVLASLAAHYVYTRK